jgi:hypothetical protein
MKVKIGKYPNRLTCRIHTRYMDKKYGFVNWPTEYNRTERLLEQLEDAIQSVYNVFNWVWFDRRTQKIKVRIDRQDTWSMDHTLAPIIGKNGEVDPKHFERWDWILDEMIWAFEQKCRDDWMEDYYYNKWDTDGANAHQSRMTNGFKLFGKYYENLWD